MTTIPNELNSPTGAKAPSDDDILTVEEVAKMLRVTQAWVRAHAGRNRRPYLPGFKAGKYVRFVRSTVREAIAKWQRNTETAVNGTERKVPGKSFAEWKARERTSNLG